MAKRKFKNQLVEQMKQEEREKRTSGKPEGKI